jgi:hypothetical protein
MIITLDCDRIQNRDDIHNQFNDALGFPSYYGRNMDALIDCLSDADAQTSGMCENAVELGQSITLVLSEYDDLKKRRPDLVDDILECIAFVNWRRIDIGEAPLFHIAFTSSSA